MPPLLWGAVHLAAAARASTAWLWQGYLAPGSVTLLTSRWKAGRTTLVSVLLSRMKTGGQLAGLSLVAGKAVVVSEEGTDRWQRRHQRLDFGDHVGWFCRPFRGKPSRADWSAFLDDAERPDKVTLSRWLERAVDQGLVRKDGRGRRSHPFRYWLPEREEHWRQDPVASLLMPELLAPAASQADPG
jgi:hypothetical protein